MKANSVINLAAVAGALIIFTRAAHADLPKALQGVGFDQRLDEQLPLDLNFTDDAGNAVHLGNYFGKRPVILALVYYQCPRLCTLVLNGLVQGLLEIPFTAGQDFEVVAVSFDPRETWDLAASKKEAYLQRYRRPGAAAGWHFLTGDQASIDALASAVGFRYQYDADQKQFIHASGIMVLTPEGRLSRYFYDVNYPGRDLRLGLVEASHDRIASPVDQVLLYCFHYDPTLGKYAASVMAFIRIGGICTILGIGGFVWFLSRGCRPLGAPPAAPAMPANGVTP